MFSLNRGKGSAQVQRDIPFSPPGSDGVTKNFATVLECTVGRLEGAALFDLSNGPEIFGCGNGGDGLFPDMGEDIALEAKEDSFAMAFRPGRAELEVPFESDHLKAVGRFLVASEFCLF